MSWGGAKGTDMLGEWVGSNGVPVTRRCQPCREAVTGELKGKQGWQGDGERVTTGLGLVKGWHVKTTDRGKRTTV